MTKPLLLTLLLACPVFATAEVRVVAPREYVDVLQQEISRAKKSITACLYVFSVSPTRPQSESMKIIDALVAAQARGVKVEVILDAGQEWRGEDVVEAGKNQVAYEVLAGRGVDVFFTTAAAVVHAKAVVFDRSSVLLGSTNWSEAAFSRNIEANALIRDPHAARRTLGIIQQGGRARAPATELEAAQVPAAFLTESRYLASLTREPDERAFDVYLWLLKTMKGSSLAPLDYRPLAESLGIDREKISKYQWLIRKALAKLHSRRLIAYVKPRHGQAPQVRLLPLPGDSVGMPAAYWDLGWSRRLAYTGKVMYLVGRYRAQRSPLRPRWSASIDTISREHGLGESSVSDGTTVLRRANLLEVDYDETVEASGQARHPNIYTPRFFYDPAVIPRTVERLTRQHGREKVARAQKCLALIYEDSDMDALEQFIRLEEEYGPARVEQIYQILALKRPDNPKRSLGYFIGAIKGAGE